jgi:hypothetical protein
LSKRIENLHESDGDEANHPGLIFTVVSDTFTTSGCSLMKQAPAKVHRIAITQAHASLRQIARRAHAEKAYFVLEDHGKPIAGIVGIDDLEDFLDIHDPKMQAHIRRSHQEYLAGKGRDAWGFLAELEGELKPSRPKRKLV